VKSTNYEAPHCAVFSSLLLVGSKLSPQHPVLEYPQSMFVPCAAGKVYLYNKLLLRDFGPYGIIFKNACVIIVAMVLLLRDFGTYGIIFKNACVIIVAMVLLLRNFGTYGIIFKNACVIIVAMVLL
jgi:uncharacterized YccA/Bax inhibitor family protein